MKASVKRFFLLVLAAAMVLPLFCVAPAFAAEEVHSTNAVCSHSGNKKQGKCLGYQYTQHNNSGHMKTPVYEAVCTTCGVVLMGEQILGDGTLESHSHDSRVKPAIYYGSVHAGKPYLHVLKYAAVCQFCGVDYTFTRSAGCTSAGCIPDPASMTPEVM